MIVSPQSTTTVAEDFLQILGELGVEYLFGNGGTDFPPIIEAYARHQRGSRTLPKPISVGHENVGVSMAMGAYLASGRPQALMVHVNVGTANALCGLMNAYRGNVPILFFAGRTPFTESGRRLGARSSENHWAQEMFDQAAMVRECVKWDYQLTDADALATALERAWAIAMSGPPGPVYMTLPREVLAAPAVPRRSEPRRETVRHAPDDAALTAAVDIVRSAHNPLIISTSGGRNTSDFEALARFADAFAIPVAQRKPRFMALPTDHPMHLGYDPDAFLEQADVVIAVDSDAPWVPSRLSPNPECRVIGIGSDPLFQSYPLRGFRIDVALAGPLAVVLDRLLERLNPADPDWEPALATRRKRIAAMRAEQRSGWRDDLEARRAGSAIDPVWLSHCIDRIKGADGIVVRELPLVMSQMNFEQQGCYFSPNWAAGLGSGLGTALGVKLKRPERFVICVVGDGSYMFGTPLAAHCVAMEARLPVLTVIFDNARWDAVRRSTRGMYPEGAASADGYEPFTYFSGEVAYEKVVEAAGGYGVRVTDPNTLPHVLEQAAEVVRGGRQAVVSVACA